MKLWVAPSLCCSPRVDTTPRLAGPRSHHYRCCRDIPHTAQGPDIPHRDARKDGAGTHQCCRTPSPALTPPEIRPPRPSLAFPPGPHNARFISGGSGRKEGTQNISTPQAAGGKWQHILHHAVRGSSMKHDISPRYSPSYTRSPWIRWHHIAFNEGL